MICQGWHAPQRMCYYRISVQKYKAFVSDQGHCCCRIISLLKLQNPFSGRFGTGATEQQVQELISQAQVLGRVLKASDASVAGFAISEGAPLITDDARLSRFLQEAGYPVEGH